MANFMISTVGHCFLCLKEILNSLTDLENDISLKSQERAINHSIQSLSRYLQIDFKKVFSSERPIPSHLLDKVQRSQLKVELCQECASINEKFSKLYEKLEKIRMEVLSHMNEVNKVLERSKKSEAFEKYESSLKQDERNMTEEKIQIVKAIRNEIIEKCYRKSKQMRPVIFLPDCQLNSEVNKNPRFNSKTKNAFKSKIRKICKPVNYSEKQGKSANRLRRGRKPSMNPPNGFHWCRWCSAKLSSRRALYRHKDEFHPQYRCKICNRGYLQKLAYIKHLQLFHNSAKLIENQNNSNLMEKTLQNGKPERKMDSCNKNNFVVKNLQKSVGKQIKQIKVERTRKYIANPVTGMYNCLICHSEFKTVVKLCHHRRYTHNIVTYRVKKRQKCDNQNHQSDEFKNEELANQHQHNQTELNNDDDSLSRFSTEVKTEEESSILTFGISNIHEEVADFNNGNTYNGSKMDGDH